MKEEGALQIATKTDTGEVQVIIRDSGCGIPQENLGKIFDPFFTTKEVGQGTGLGLHLVYHLATKHGGRVEATSRVGQGSCFTVALPAVKG